MVGNKLDNLKTEISHYLGLPYFSNNGVKRVISSENSLVGKGTAQEIALKTIELANQQNIKLLELDTKGLYNFQKKNKIGIDCSGLAFNLLHFLDSTIEDRFIGTEGKKGVRRLSANLLTSPPNSSLISDIKSITTGDLIRVNKGKHVLFIVEVIDDKVIYVDSSQNNKPKGVSYGSLNINDLSKFDGVYRPILKL